ncbi:MAG: hypothetical protein ACRC33_05710, partial [Gemmataceae bacterium]
MVYPSRFALSAWTCAAVVAFAGPTVAAETLAENARRLAAALAGRGAALPAAAREVIDRAKGGDDERVVAALAPHTLLDVTVNPEGRVKVGRGAAGLELRRGLPGYAVVKVTNQSRATPRLRPRVGFEGGGASPFRTD